MGRAQGWVRGVRAVAAAAVIAALLAVGFAGPTQAAPTNDAFADAQAISGVAGQLTGENTGASTGDRRARSRQAWNVRTWRPRVGLVSMDSPDERAVTFDAACAATPCFLIPIVDVYTGSALDALTIVPDATAELQRVHEPVRRGRRDDLHRRGSGPLTRRNGQLLPALEQPAGQRRLRHGPGDHGDVGHAVGLERRGDDRVRGACPGHRPALCLGVVLVDALVRRARRTSVSAAATSAWSSASTRATPSARSRP